MASTSDLKRGFHLQLDDGDPYQVVSLTTQSPTARGGGTLIKTKLRNIRTKQLVQKTFKSGERIDEPDFEIRSCQYLYGDGDFAYFMDDETYEQHAIPPDDVAEELGFVRENDPCRVLLHDGKPIGLEVPNTVELKVAQTEPAVRGDTVNNVTKAATLETGLEVQVPMFVEEGEVLVIDTRESRYVRRAN